MLEQLKSFVRGLGVPAWVVLAVAGCVAHLALNAALRKPLTSAWGLLAPLLLGVAIESYEIWGHYKDIGLFAPGNDPVWQIFGRHALDVLKTMSLAAMLVVVGALSSR